jgi:cytochrome P450
MSGARALITHRRVSATLRRIADLHDPQLWASGGEAAEFGRLRREEPVSWQPDPTAEGFTAGPGFWAVVRHADVLAVSTDPKRFSSSPTTSIRDLPPALGEFFGSMLNMDDPRHAALRRVMSHAFTPRRLADLRELVAAVAVEAVDQACRAGTCDGVETIAARVPLRVLCELMGIPTSDWDAVSQHGHTLSVARDSASMMAAAKAIHGMAERLAEERRAAPGDDLTSALVHSSVDGTRLAASEIGSFLMLLVVAGVQTTRHAISHGLVVLAAHEAQRKRWLADPDAVTPTAVEEVLRWATPVCHFRRTATQDATIGKTRSGRATRSCCGTRRPTVMRLCSRTLTVST